MKNRWYRDIFYDLYKIRHLRGIDTFYDLGANIGVFAIYARCLFPYARIISVEALINNTLKMNSRIFGFIIEDMVIGNGKAFYLEEGSCSMNHRFTEKTNCKDKFRSQTLGNLISKYHTEDSSYMVKADIEGSEKYFIGDSVSEEFLYNARQVSMEVHFGEKFGIEWRQYDRWISRLFIKHDVLYYKSNKNRGYGHYIIERKI